MIFREGNLKVIQVNYELVDKTGRLLQAEVKAGILATTPQQALQQLRKVISRNCEIRINQLGDAGCIHIITDEVVNILTGKDKNTKAKTEEAGETLEDGTPVRKAGRPPGSKNKPKV